MRKGTDGIEMLLVFDSDISAFNMEFGNWTYALEVYTVLEDTSGNLCLVLCFMSVVSMCCLFFLSNLQICFGC